MLIVDKSSPSSPGDEPVRAIVTLGDADAASAGARGESAFAPIHCSFSANGSTLRCKSWRRRFRLRPPVGILAPSPFALPRT
jgi:hypothetical protein